jgi:cysteine synthase A
MIKATNGTLPTSILQLIGHTPVIRLGALFPEVPLHIFAKLEGFNPGGSMKDRTALSILREAFANGRIKAGDTIIESSSGNLAIGLAQACIQFGLKFIAVVDPHINSHTLKILRTYGAMVDMVHEKDENGSYLNTRIRRVQELHRRIKNSFWTNQYANLNNPLAQRRTLQEFIHQIQQVPDYLLVATSTCGTIMGCADLIRECGYNTKLIAVDAVGSVLFDQQAAPRLLPGHGASRPSVLLDHTRIDRVIHVSDLECVMGCHQLLQREAILSGASSGGIIAALDSLLPQLPANSCCAIILPDKGERYLDTVYSIDWIASQFDRVPDFIVEFQHQAVAIESDQSTYRSDFAA